MFISRRILNVLVLLAFLLSSCASPTPQVIKETVVVKETQPVKETVLAVITTTPQPAAAGVVNVYSARHYGAMEGVLQRFTQETGIEVRVSQGSVQTLLQRLEAEGQQTPADVFMSIDAGGLVVAANKGLLQPIESEILLRNIPETLRDPQNRWFGLTQRVRTIVYNPTVVKPEELSTYADLADPKWKNRLCLRPATHIYTVALVASMIAELGEAETQAIVKGWVANEPQYIDSDTRILETIEAGGCDVGITNHYYLARKLSENPNFGVALLWANQAGTGVHRNISGMGVTAAARNRENAIRLIEWLSEQGQAADNTGLPGGNFEYPVNPNAPIHTILQTFGEFKVNPIPLATYGEFQEAAVKLLESAGYK
ncbi:MAG: Fe(3+) ABC transporter substrate-binding protein [Anaerolineae bacterium]|nr:MAG: Fe(3+) ABC transporter substrate-binding protein [Anaerolineae bacterium]